jgi:hypothetical protein
MIPARRSRFAERHQAQALKTAEFIAQLLLENVILQVADRSMSKCSDVCLLFCHLQSADHFIHTSNSCDNLNQGLCVIAKIQLPIESIGEAIDGMDNAGAQCQHLIVMSHRSTSIYITWRCCLVLCAGVVLCKNAIICSNSQCFRRTVGLSLSGGGVPARWTAL